MSAEPEQSSILVVEDNPTESLALRNHLRFGKYEPLMTRNAEEAIAVLKEQPVDLVLSDIDMPGMSGYEMCSQIKQDERWNAIPVILLTTLSTPLNILQGLEARCDYYLTKPYTRDLLLRSVKELLDHAPGPPEPDGEPLEVFVEGDQHQVTAGRRHLVNLLFSTYDCAVRQNKQLISTQAELHERNQQLRSQQELLKQANEKLEELAQTDGLTGLKNHRTFKTHLKDEYQRSARYGEPLSLMMMDVDKFKPFNDTFGHPAGDEVLKEVARIIVDSTRSTDLVARYGGEEFVVLLPYTEREAALGLAERIRANIEAGNWEKREITVSIGVGTMENETIDMDKFVSSTDEALYHSKLTGRNRVTHVDEIPQKADN